MTEFEIGNKVEKIKGYRYPGVIVAKFTTIAGLVRYVVECTVPECSGMLHIYNGEQIQLRSACENEKISRPEKDELNKIEKAIDQEYLMRRLNDLLEQDKSKKSRAKIILRKGPLHGTEKEWLDDIMNLQLENYKWYSDSPDYLMYRSLENTEKLFEPLKSDIQNLIKRQGDREILDKCLNVIDNFERMCQIFGNFSLEIFFCYGDFINADIEDRLRKIALKMISYLNQKINQVLADFDKKNQILNVNELNNALKGDYATDANIILDEIGQQYAPCFSHDKFTQICRTVYEMMLIEQKKQHGQPTYYDSEEFAAAHREIKKAAYRMAEGFTNE